MTASRVPETLSPRAGYAAADPAAPPRRPLHALTGLRLFAALAVYFSHLPSPAGAPEWLGTLQASGYAGVTFFFVLSGFVLALNYFDSLRTPRQVWSYTAARVARVYPLYLVVLAWPSVHLWAADTLVGSTFVQKVLLVQAWSPDLNIAFGTVGPAWSISVELFLYATLPLLVPLVRRIDRRVAYLLAAALVVLLALAALAWFFETSGRADLPVTDAASAHRWLYRTPLSRIGDFLLGIVAARVYVRLRSRDASRRLGWMLIPAAVCWTFLVAAQPGLLESAWSWDAIYALPAVTLILGLALAPQHPVSRALGARAAVFLGEASFAFYLVHITVIRLVGAGGWADGVTPRTLLVEAMNLLFAVALAIGLHVGIERPARTVVRRLLDPPTRVSARRPGADRPVAAPSGRPAPATAPVGAVPRSGRPTGGGHRPTAGPPRTSSTGGRRPVSDREPLVPLR